MTAIATVVPLKGEPAHFSSHLAAPHLAVQILGLLLFSGFAIVSTVLAFVNFWPAGFALALALAWFGFRPILGGRLRAVGTHCLGPVVSTEQGFAKGNTSFNAYRDDVLRRLEEEQASFDGFLARLRDAKDAGEFDNFMEDRARSNREAAADDAAGNGLDARAPHPKAGEY